MKSVVPVKSNHLPSRFLLLLIQEKRFSDLKFDSGYYARFDFYLPDYNTIIEYDGIQHFIQGSGVFDNKEKFARTQEHDSIKNQYCKDKNIALLRIPYWDKNNIKQIVIKYLENLEESAA